MQGGPKKKDKEKTTAAKGVYSAKRMANNTDGVLGSMRLYFAVGVSSVGFKLRFPETTDFGDVFIAVLSALLDPTMGSSDFALSEEERGGRRGLESSSGAGSRIGWLRPGGLSEVWCSELAMPIGEAGSSSVPVNVSTSSYSSSASSSSSIIWLFRVAGRAALREAPSTLASSFGYSDAPIPPDTIKLAVCTIGPLKVVLFRRAKTRLEEGEYNIGAGAASLNDELAILSESSTSRNPLLGFRTSRMLEGKRADAPGVVGSTLTEV